MRVKPHSCSSTAKSSLHRLRETVSTFRRSAQQLARTYSVSSLPTILTSPLHVSIRQVQVHAAVLSTNKPQGAPNFHPGQADFSTIDAALNWMAWPNNGNNKAPTAGANVTVEEGDEAYIAALGSANTYIAREYRSTANSRALIIF